MNSLFTFSTATLLVLLAGFLFLADSAYRYANRILASLLVIFSLHLILLTLRFEQNHVEAYALNGLLAMCIGPLIFLYCRAVLCRQTFSWTTWMIHAGPLCIMLILQTNLPGIPPAAKDFAVILSFAAYATMTLKLSLRPEVASGIRATHKNQAVTLARGLATFLFILALLDLAFFYQITWLEQRHFSVLHTVVVIAFALCSFAMTYAGLARMPLLSWAFSTKYETAPAQGGFSPEQLDEALARLEKFVACETLHFEPDASVQNFADRIEVPPRLLSAVVNQRLGLSFRRYINDLRIEEAKKRLASTNVPVLTIMFDVGFQTKSNFYSEFFAATSMSPGNFRKSARAASSAS